MTFDEYGISIAEAVAQKSKDPSTKVGCAIFGENKGIRSTGWNGFPIGVEDDPEKVPERYERPEKYSFTCHAEANAMALAAASGTPLAGSTAYVTHHPCDRCAAMLIQAGIKRVVVGHGHLVGDHNTKIAETLMKEAGVQLDFIEKIEENEKSFLTNETQHGIKVSSRGERKTQRLPPQNQKGTFQCVLIFPFDPLFLPFAVMIVLW